MENWLSTAINLFREPECLSLGNNPSIRNPGLLGAQSLSHDQQVKTSASRPLLLPLFKFSLGLIVFLTSSTLPRCSAGHLHSIILSSPRFCTPLRLLDSKYKKLQSHSRVLYGLCSSSNAVFLGINSLASYIFS